MYSLCQQGGRVNQHGNIAGAVKTYVPSCRVERKLHYVSKKVKERETSRPTSPGLALAKSPVPKAQKNQDKEPEPEPVPVVEPCPLDGSTDTAMPCATVTETVAVLM